MIEVSYENQSNFSGILTALGLISIVLVYTPATLASTVTGTLECADFTAQDTWGFCNRTEKTNVDELHNKKTWFGRGLIPLPERL